MRATLVGATATLLLLAGCAGTKIELPPEPELTLVPAPEPLWFNPQTEPHPAYGFPTLTRPAVGVNGSQVPEFWVPIPVAALPNPITGLEHVVKAPKATSGAGLATFGGLAVVPGFRKATHIFDIRDPTQPVVLETLGAGHRNVDFIPYPDGRLVAIFATEVGSLELFDLTDPRAPEELEPIEVSTGTHKVNVVPGTPIAYNANSQGGGTMSNVPSLATGQTEIYDLSDPEKPVERIFKNGYGCHHIYFYVDPPHDYYRALCAGLEMTQIWDIRDPLDPKVLVNVPVHQGDPNLPSTAVMAGVALRFSHFAIFNYDHSVLIVGDETGGGGLPGCDAHAEAAGLSASGVGGNIYFYDVKDESKPKLLGWYHPTPPTGLNDESPTCTAHHGRLVPDPAGRDLIAMAFYGAGVALVDFSDPANAKTIGEFRQGTNTWEAQYYNGYVFTGDLRRGMDVLRFR